MKLEILKPIFFILFLLSACCFSAKGQDATAYKYALRNQSTSFGLSVEALSDHYLSPMPYSGIGLNTRTEIRQLFSPENINLSNINRTGLSVGMTVNPAVTASVMFIGLNYGWGMHYHFRPVENLQILAGGLADVNFKGKLNNRNVNNPANIDLSVGLNLSAVAIYDIPTNWRTVRLQAEIEVPFIGAMFVPEYGSSYYEAFMMKSKGKYVHFSSFHNKQGFDMRYFAEIAFRSSTWRLGICSRQLIYAANQLYFKNAASELFIGYSKTLFRFSEKHPAPHNFINY